VRRDPNFVQALSTLASARYMTGDVDACIELCNKALAVEANFGPAYNNLALAYLEKGDPKKAMECVEKAKATNFECHPGLIEDIKKQLAKA